MVVYTTATDGPYAQLADEVAAHRDEAVVSDLTEISPTEPVRCVDRPDQLSPDTLYHLVEQRVNASVGAVDVALVTGRTPAEASALFERMSSEQPDRTQTGHHVVIPDSERAIDTPGDTRVLTDDSATVEAMQGIGKAASLSAVLHGKNPYARLADGLLVGFPSTPGAFEFPSPQPPFVVGTDAETEPPRIDLEDPAVRAEDIAADEIFLDSCSSLLAGTNRGTDQPVHVALGLLSQAQSMIGTFRVTECIPFHGMLHHGLLRAGYPPAQRAYLLNRAAATAGLESYPYLIAGDPWTTPTDTLPMAYEHDWTVVSDEPRAYVEITDADSPVIDLRIPVPDDSPGEKGTKPYFLRLLEGTPEDPLFYTAFREGASVRIVIGAWGHVTADRLRFSIQPTATVDDPTLDALAERELDRDTTLQGVGDDIAAAERRALAGPVDGSARNHLEEARFQLRASNTPLTDERSDPTAYTTTIEALGRAADALEHARTTVVEEVVRDTDRLSLQDEYRHWTSAAGGSSSPGACPYCGATVHVATRADQFSPVARALGRCPNCAYVYDLPADAPSTAIPELHGEFMGATGNELSVEITFTNPLDRRVEATVVVTITDEAVSDDDVLATPVQDLSLAPHEQGRVETPIDLAALRESVTFDGEREVTIDPDPSYFGPTFREHRDDAVDAVASRIAADPAVLDGGAVPVEVAGDEDEVPTEAFDAEVTERAADRIIGDLDGFYTVEADVVCRDLAVYSGIRTLYPDI